jgi:hypothetical protein
MFGIITPLLYCMLKIAFCCQDRDPSLLFSVTNPLSETLAGNSKMFQFSIKEGIFPIQGKSIGERHVFMPLKFT